MEEEGGGGSQVFQLFRKFQSPHSEAYLELCSEGESLYVQPHLSLLLK